MSIDRVELVKALVRLCRSTQAKRFLVEFAGANNHGRYERIRVEPEMHVPSGLSPNLETIERFLHKQLENQFWVNFKHRGSRGHIAIHFQGWNTQDMFQLTLTVLQPYREEHVLIEETLGHVETDVASAINRLYDNMNCTHMVVKFAGRSTTYTCEKLRTNGNNRYIHTYLNRKQDLQTVERFLQKQIETYIHVHPCTEDYEGSCGLLLYRHIEGNRLFLWFDMGKLVWEVRYDHVEPLKLISEFDLQKVLTETPQPN